MRNDYEELLADDLDGLLDQPDELGSIFSAIGKAVKSVGKVARSALKVAKIIPGIGSIAAAVDMGLDVADKVAGGLKGKGGGKSAAPQRASKSKAKPKKPVSAAARTIMSSATSKARTEVAQALDVKPVKPAVDVNAAVSAAARVFGPQLQAMTVTAQQLNTSAKIKSEHSARLKQLKLQRLLSRRLS